MPHQSTNLYALLGVTPDADRKAIRARYAALMQRQKKHPDLGGTHDEAAQLTEAYTVLRDPIRRALYDKTCTQLARTAAVVSTAAPVPDRRQSRRIPYQGLIELQARGRCRTVGQTRDVSRHGCSFRTICPLMIGEKITLSFEDAPGDMLEATVQWTRRHPQRFGPMLYEVGVEFVEAADVLVNELARIW